jgi:hypothetical protein
MPSGIGSIISAGTSLLGAGAQKGGNDSANAANQAAIAEAKAQAQKGFDANTGTIKDTKAESGAAYRDAYGKATGQYTPIIDRGDNAYNQYADLSGLNGTQAQQQSQNNMMASPVYTTGATQATQQTQAQYGNKLGSGAFARALQDNQTRYAQQYTNNQLQQYAPVMQAGNQARGAQAGTDMKYGDNAAGNSYWAGNANISNQNKLTDAFMNAALGSGASNAQNARANGQADAGAFGAVGSAFSSAFGGNKGGGGGGGSSWFNFS